VWCVLAKAEETVLTAVESSFRLADIDNTKGVRVVMASAGNANVCQVHIFDCCYKIRGSRPRNRVKRFALSVGR
jgi:hypothetical protein